ncbi:MAG: TIGR01777 family oxidoreductase [Actinomycetia bacterium]|nr:TIGR01777 family oxidoreductase [Actinomycetes bacterium]
MRVAITGASGFIGSALTQHLGGSGAEVVHLVRRSPRADHERRWDPATAHLDPETIADCDGIVSLHGAGIGDRRWSPTYKMEILTSRTHGTRAIAGALAALAGRGRQVRWVSGSAVGFYGDRGEEVLTEDSPAGEGFLSEVVRAWEGATEAATQAGVPVAQARTGIVLSPDGGALRPLLLMTRLGLGGPFGRGRAWWPWITLQDHVRALAFLLDNSEITGPVNLAGPDERRQGEVVRAIARALRRPALLPVPPPALRLVMGEFADDILASQRVIPQVLQEAGFAFEHPTVQDAAAWVAQR